MLEYMAYRKGEFFGQILVNNSTLDYFDSERGCEVKLKTNSFRFSKFLMFEIFEKNIPLFTE